MAEQLKACPHCGGVNFYIDNHTYEGVYDTAQVVCSACGMCGPTASGSGNIILEAQRLWNALPRR